MNNYRKCDGVEQFNTGTSKCPLNPDKVRGVILVMHGYKLPASLTAEALRQACHADRPNRIMPIKNIIEYAPNGGEAQVSANGYGPNKVTGFSPRVDTFTLEDPDFALRSNLIAAANVPLDVYLYDESNVIYGVSDGTDQLAGIELSGVYPSGQDFDSSGTEANLSVNLMIKDVKKYMKNASYVKADFDVENALTGLVYVEFQSEGSGAYRLVEHYGKLDITPYFGALIASKASEVLNGASSASYEGGLIKATASGSLTLKSPSVLFENEIVGIEQWS